MKAYPGWTIMELAITIALIAIMGILLIPRSPSPKTTLSSKAIQIVHDIRYTQALAMARNQHYRIRFYGNHRYNISDNLNNPVTHPATQTTDIQLGGNFHFIGLPAPKCVAFDGMGVPLICSTEAPNPSNESFQLEKDGDTATITITAQTGFTTMSMP